MEFPNLNALTRHKPTCPALNGETPVCQGKVEVNTTPEPIYDQKVKPLNRPDLEHTELIIPIDSCPEEVKLYAEGHTVGLRVEGKLAPAGIIVQEVKLIR